ncbi:DUF3800 domain-containing protein [Vibrio cyclitrophicus]
MKKDGVYIYADESGNTGKHIFQDSSKEYFQGAVLVTEDIESLVASIIEEYCKENGLDRLHGFELGEERTNSLCIKLLDALDSSHWEFQYTIVQKRYLAPTKFVDTFFDCWDNPAVPMTWYVTDLYRHTLCLVIDSMMHDGLDECFWQCYLNDDLDGLMAICKELLNRSRHITDIRIREVVSDALSYAVKNPELFTLVCAKGKSAYKKQMPNMVAFSSLLNSIHAFCNKHGVGVKQFVHDQNDEFRGTMREFHKLYFPHEQEAMPFGGIPLLKEFVHNTGEFILASSKNTYGLQVVDLLLWLLQRDSSSEKLSKTRERLLSKSVDYRISRQMSALIVEARRREVMSAELSSEDLAAGRKFGAEMEAKRSSIIGKRI